MKALSLWQPWAGALFAPSRHLQGLMIKIDETRHWPAPLWLIGERIAIHAALRWTRDEKEFWSDMPDGSREAFAKIGITDSELLPRGVLIGTAVLQQCISTNEFFSPSSQYEIARSNDDWGNFSDNRFAWRFVNHRRFETPIPCKGRQGIFNVEIPDTAF